MHITDFSTPAFFADPYPTYERLRAEGDLLPLMPGVLVTGRHAVIEALLKDRRLGRNYLSGVKYRYGERSELPIFAFMARMMLTINPPKHTRLRGLLMKAFNMRQLAEMRQLVEQVADTLVDKLMATGTYRADLVGEFALRLPAEVICHMLDVPIEDALQLTQAARVHSQVLDLAPLSDDNLAAANTATLDLDAYFRPLLAQRRARPGKDLISLLLTIEEDGEMFTEDEIVANVVLLFIAGHETTSGMIGNALIALHRHPDQWQKLCADPGLAHSAVMECLRYDSSVQRTAYSVLEPAEYEGHQLEPGQFIVMFTASANRDPARFENPDQLDITRAPDSQRLLSFGGGVHYCLGARLATLEIEVALQTLIKRLPGLSLEGLDQLSWLPRNTLRSVDALWANWTPLD